MTTAFFEDDPEVYLATVNELLEAEGARELAQILRTSTIRVEQTGYDNWNGGTKIWTLFLELEARLYSSIEGKKEAYQEKVSEKLKAMLGEFENDWYSVSIIPQKNSNPNWRKDPAVISKDTIGNIIDGLKIDKVNWAGELGEVEFLQRIFNLEEMPSFDSRFETASGDIWQHRENNPDDWEDDWIYDDVRFNLRNGSPDTFLRFLCEVVHPVVRPDKNSAIQIANQFNDQLRKNGWQLVAEEKIAGRPRYVPKKVVGLDSRSSSRARNVADALDAGWMQKEIERVESSIETDPSLAIGTAKDLVETCCKTILNKLDVEYPKGIKFPKLTGMVVKELRLVPDEISEKAKGAEAIRLILRNLSALTQYVAELRGLYGSGHGKDGQHRGLEPRHARIAVGAAVIFIDFVTSTYHKQSSEQ